MEIACNGIHPRISRGAVKGCRWFHNHFVGLHCSQKKGQASACSGMMKGEAMIILEDMGQKEEKHTVKNQWFYENGIDVVRVPLRWEIML